MSSQTPVHSRLLRLGTEPLTQRLFSDFGTVIENSLPGRIPSHEKQAPPNAISANQGTAHKYLDVTRIKNYYGSAPSGMEAKAVMNMFVCSPRDLEQGDDGAIVEGLFPVKILERHPFTSQTFIPMGLSKKEMNETRYLVIVAPSLPPSTRDQSLPVPTVSDAAYPGRGLPDLQRIRAFLAHGSQAVTYSAGTWHAPMVVLGQKAIDFVVVQYANGIDNEDCQEVILEAEEHGKETNGISVIIQQSPNRGLWRL